MICKADSGKFCRGSTDNIVIEDVCANYNMLPTMIKNSTSIGSICQADLDNMCVDPIKKPAICGDGYIKPNLCSLYPSKCAAGTNEYDRCAENWYECAVDPNWHYCNSFPELCLGAAYTDVT